MEVTVPPLRTYLKHWRCVVDHQAPSIGMAVLYHRAKTRFRPPFAQMTWRSSTRLNFPGTSVTTASRSRMLPLAVNYDPPAAIKLFPATTRARSAVGPSLSLAQQSGTHCQTSSATHRYRSTVSVASLKHSCLQTRSSVHSALESFCWCAI